MSNLNKFLNLYDKEVMLPGSFEKVTIKPLTTNQMKKLLFHENETDPVVGEEIIDQMISSVVVTESFNIDNIFIQDKYFLFLEIRKLTKGDNYQFIYECPECGYKSIQNVDLNNLVVNNFNKLETNTVSILNDQVILHLGHITRGEQKEAYNLIERKLNENQKKVEMIISTLAQAIKKVETPDGEEILTLKEKVEFVGDLPEREYKKINEWFEENNFGVDLNINIQCKNTTCNYKTKESLPISNFFD